VMMANITFLSFLLFSMCHSIHVAVNTWLNCSFFYINVSNNTNLNNFHCEIFCSAVSNSCHFYVAYDVPRLAGWTASSVIWRIIETHCGLFNGKVTNVATPSSYEWIPNYRRMPAHRHQNAFTFLIGRTTIIWTLSMPWFYRARQKNKNP